MTRPLDRRMFLSPNEPHCPIQASRVSFTPLALTLAVLVTALALSEVAFARGSSHRNRSRHNAAAAAARKKQTVAAIQAEVASARQVLAAAESAGSLSQSQLDDIRKRMVSVKEAMAEAVNEEREIRQELQELEKEVLEAQSPESEFGRAQARLAAARRAVENFRAQYGKDWDGLTRVLHFRQSFVESRDFHMSLRE